MSVPTSQIPWCIRAGLLMSVTATCEVIYTACSNGYPKYQGHTQLPVMGAYFFGAIAFERLREKLRPNHVVFRIIAYVAMIFIAEYALGWTLERTTGECPWKYNNVYNPYHIHGYINPPYAFGWGVIVGIAEKLNDLFLSLEWKKKAI